MNRRLWTCGVAVLAVLAAACSASRSGPATSTTSAPPAPCARPVPWPSRIPERCEPASTTAPAPRSSIPTYTSGSADGSGWSTQPLDQPRPLPGVIFSGWFTDIERGVCQWLTPDLLTAFEWTGEKMNTFGPPCVIPIVNNQILQIDHDGPYASFSGPIVDDIAFMRSITIAGLEAREYDFVPDQEKHPGSCSVEVNTRSLSQIHVLAGTADGTAPGTDPAPMCDRARRVATLMAQTFVPLAGGAPWPPTPQQPTPQALAGHRACELVGVSVVSGFIEGVQGTEGAQGTATTCTWILRDIRAVAWLGVDLPSAWQGALPPLADNELTTDVKLGIMPARLQLTPDGTVCSEAVQYTAGQVLRIAYQNPLFTPEILCRIAEEFVGSVIAKLADSTAR